MQFLKDLQNIKVSIEQCFLFEENLKIEYTSFEKFDLIYSEVNLFQTMWNLVVTWNIV